jgi:hypothetical protein
MWGISLGDLIAGVCRELADSVEQSSAHMAASESGVRMRIGDVDFDTPVRFRFGAQGEDGERIAVALPGTRDQPDGVGRLHLRIEAHYPENEHA